MIVGPSTNLRSMCLPAGLMAGDPSLPSASQPDVWIPSTPQDAAQAPIFDPSVLVTLMSAINILESVRGDETAHLAVNISTTSPNTPPAHVSVDYVADLNSENVVTESGEINRGPVTQVFQDVLRPDNLTSTKVSGETENLALSQKDGGWQIDGRVGTVDTHLQLTTTQSAGVQTYHATGTLGGVSYLSDTTVKVTSEDGGGSTRHIAMSGHVGDAPIAREYDVVWKQGPNGMPSAHCSGRGTNAGVTQQIVSDLQFESKPSASDIDFSSVDTAQKASVLPSMNPITAFVLDNALSTAAEFGSAVSCKMQETLGTSTAANLTYDISGSDLKTMHAEGTLGAASFQETWTLDPDSGIVQISGSVGNSAEKLTLTDGPDGRHVDGTIGTVAVHQVITQQQGDLIRYVWDGNVADRKNHQEMTIMSDAQQNPIMHVAGNLGDAAVSLDATSTHGSDWWGMSGQGNVAGIAVSGTVNLQFKPASA